MKVKYQKLDLVFKIPVGTSRGIMKTKSSWILTLEQNGIQGIGEISIIEGLSPDFSDEESFERKISGLLEALKHGTLKIGNGVDLINQVVSIVPDLRCNPSILFGIETALLDLQNGGKRIIFDNDFTRGIRKIPINGLIWMGSEDFMNQQIQDKLAQGYSTIKMKIGAIDLETELTLLNLIREKYVSKQITLRVDANGAFSSTQAREVLKELKKLKIHSIEQPIMKGQWEEMRDLCRETQVPIALDEELIGIYDRVERIKLLDTIQPQYIILKPSLHGGISGCKEWIELAEERKIQWWLTSALESNIGLAAICQFAGEYDNDLPQGLGTGSLYTNNTPSNLEVENGFIFYK